MVHLCEQRFISGEVLLAEVSSELVTDSELLPVVHFMLSSSCTPSYMLVL
jgi:hypothetical protein